MTDPIRTDTGSIAIRATASSDGTLTTIEIFGPLTQATRELFKRLVLEEVAEARTRTAFRHVRLDFAHCTDLDIMGVGCLALVAKRMREQGAIVHAGGLKAGDDLRKLFELTKLDQVIAIEPEPAHG